MAQARPDYTIVLSLIGVLLAIGIPSISRGQLWVGWVCIGLALAITAWTLLGLRGRHGGQ
ncbi:MAG: hypothetical protein L6R30_07390 [Thermoanaerobaculia bacterium]|nr:hypothetical protein [Thermoanaerobaculia bacterium]